MNIIEIDSNPLTAKSSMLPENVLSTDDGSVASGVYNFQSILLSLSNELAANRNKGDLLQVLNIRLKELFPIIGFGITLLNEDGKTHSPFVVDSDAPIKDDIDYEKVITLKYSIDDGVYNAIVTKSKPVLLNVDEVTPMVETADYVAFWKKLHVKQVIGNALHVAGKNIGCLILLLENDTTQQINEDLMIGVCAAVSVAVSNIKSNEEVIRQEVEKTILLSLSNEIAAVRNREDLAKVINSKLRELFSIKEFGIAQISADGNNYDAFMLDMDKQVTSHADYKKVTSCKYSVKDPVFSQIMKSPGPVVLDVNDLAITKGVPAYVSFWKNVDFQQILGVPLRVGGKDIGVAFLTVDEESVTTVNIQLLKSVFSQVSIAISNILSNDEILRQEEEKTLLLDFSNAVAGLRTRNDLSPVINSQLKNIFSLERFAIATINEDRKTHKAFIMGLGDLVTNGEDFAHMVNTTYDLHDPVFGAVLKSDEPVLLDVDKLSLDGSMPIYVGFWKKEGFKFLLCMQLRVGGNDIGVIFFNIDNPGALQNLKTNLLKGVSAQIAIAVSNILSLEIATNREQEKSVLLEFSNNIAAIRDRFLLAKVLTGQLNKLFGIHDYAIHALSGDKKTHRPILYDPDAKFAKTPVFQQMIAQRSDVNDGVFNRVINAKDMLTFNINDWVNASKPPTYTTAAVSLGIVNLTGIAIKLGDEAIAVMNFRHDDSNRLKINKQLFKSICSQLAIVVSNLITHDEITVKEQEKSVLLEFSNNIAAIRDRFLLAKVLTDQLNKLFGIQDYAIHALSEDKKTHRPILYDPDAEITKAPVFQQMIAHPSDVNDGVFNRVLNATEPLTFNIDDWVYYSKPPMYTEAAVSLGIVTLTGTAIRLGDEAIAVMNFRHDDSKRLETNKKLFKSICSQLATAVSNIIANEKIENQLSEINKYKQQLEEEKIYLKEEIATTLNYSEIIGESPEIKKIFRLINQVAATDSTVLLLGETGTGKELVARAIHNSSARKNKLMVKLNCAALPATLIESELFGHERGSFTGAIERRIGKFELANNGTFFLDEIGEMPLELQVKLLRALQEQEIERVGGKATIKINVRIIAATNRDLEKEMVDGRFRSDLYYRLNIFPISLPPLRNRKEDIPILASSFATRFAKKSGKQISNFSKKALQDLSQYDWPGNIRELEHMIERSVLLTTGDTINEIHLPNAKQNNAALINHEADFFKTIDENEKEHILKILKHVKGKISGDGGAAVLLGIPPSTLNSKMKRLGIKKKFT